MTSEQTNVIRVLVVDDHAIVRQGVVALLEKRPEIQIVGDATDGRDAIEQYRRHRPDVALMDLRMPGLDGAETIALLRREFPDSRFIVLTSFDGDEDVFQALRAGAQGYLLKGMSGDELVDAIKTVAEGKRWIPAALAARAHSRTAMDQLTDRESDVLRLVVAGKSNKEIGAELDLQESTVKSYLTSVFGKLGVTSRTQAIVVALQRGLVSLDAGPG
jgi:DNA-binding NarL/FixJ family response regulator